MVVTQFEQRVDIIRSIGQLDRCLSELKIMALDAVDGKYDRPDFQTIKHHAEDCVGLGTRVLEILSGGKSNESTPK